ncbi:hypothetical protein BD414DRAFT_151396 [Trametes punicea]|nr:hypothetical protein BD414DRAFT_151396 [Trametes punicea]
MRTVEACVPPVAQSSRRSIRKKAGAFLLVSALPVPVPSCRWNIDFSMKVIHMNARRVAMQLPILDWVIDEQPSVSWALCPYALLSMTQDSAGYVSKRNAVKWLRWNAKPRLRQLSLASLMVLPSTSSKYCPYSMAKNHKNRLQGCPTCQKTAATPPCIDKGHIVFCERHCLSLFPAHKNCPECYSEWQVAENQKRELNERSKHK